MAETTTETILERGRAFMESRVLLTAVELDVFTLLAHRAMTAGALATTLGADLRGMTTLLDVVAAIGLLEKENGAYRCAGDAA